MKHLVLATVTTCLLACGSPGGPDAGTGGGLGTDGGSTTGGDGGGGSSDTTPPQVISVTPGSTAINVAVATSFQVVFSEPMAIDTVSVSISPSLALGSPSWNSDNTQLSLTPAAPLAFDTTYTVTLSGSDTAGNALSPLTLSFTTVAAPDTTAPTVISTAPTSASTGIATAGPVVITFSESMNPSSVLVSASPSAAFGTPAWSANNSVVTVVPSPALAPSTAYTFSVTGRDVAGNDLASAHTFTFTTAAPPDTTPPTLASSTPATGAADVAWTTRLTFTFSEPMNTGGVTVTTSPALDLGVPSWSNGDQTVAFQVPAADWAPATSYTVTLAGADVAGNALGATSVTFFTALPPDTTPPAVLATTPAPGATAVLQSTKVQFVFSEPMNTTDTQAALTTSPAVTCAFAWSAGDSVLECTPNAPLADLTLHTFTVGTGAKDKNGNPLASDVSTSFTTAAAPDTTAPTLASTVPLTTAGLSSPGTIGVMNVAADGTVLFDRITLNFSEPMNQASVEGGFTVTDDAPSTTLMGGTFSWNAAGTEVTYQLPPSAVPMPPGTVVTFSVSSAATDLANNPLVAPDTGARYFRLRQRTTLNLYSCGSTATSTCNAANPSAPSGYIIGPDASCLSSINTVTYAGQQGGYLGFAGDFQDDITVYRTYLTFDLSPMGQRPYDNNLSIVSAVANVYQTNCYGAPYKPSLGRVAALYDTAYGATLENADCALTPGNSATLTDSITLGFKTADVTDLVRTQWTDRSARANLSQFLLRVSAGPSANASADYCVFTLWGYSTTSQRPYLTTTFEYD